MKAPADVAMWDRMAFRPTGTERNSPSIPKDHAMPAHSQRPQQSSSPPQPARVSRRSFLAASLSGIGTAAVRPAIGWGTEPTPAAPQPVNDLPRLDLHVHLDNSTIDKVLELSRALGVKFGIVEHAGTEENKYPVVLSNDEELGGYLAMLDGKPVYRGVQTEWHDWAGCFSPKMLARLDYILTDAMTFPGRDGQRVKLWEPNVETRVEMSDKQAFMERYVDWYLAIIEQQPIDILANVSWLPAPLAADYDRYWTNERVRRVADAAVRHRVALEISSSYLLPKRRFLEVAKAAGVKFTFGSNGRYPHMGKLEYSLHMARELGLTPADMFTPAPDGQKAVQRRLAKK
jgi:histidinol phosphatase-like PHP family hydrolase